MKKIVTFAASAALLAAAVIPAMAVGNNCSNGTTGPFSENSCTVNNTSNVTVNNINDAQITNNVRSEANSGGNHASYNTLGGSITTGNATLNTTVSTVANINTTNITGGPAMSGNSGSNNVTGPGAGYYGAGDSGLGGIYGQGTNDVYINNAQDLTVNNSNTAFVTNDVKSTSETGDNRADFNTGPAAIRTGSAALSLGVATHVNDNFTTLNAGAGGSGGNSAGNSTTGPFSENGVTLNTTADVLVNNINDMVVKNRVNADASSGDNAARDRKSVV